MPQLEHIEAIERRLWSAADTLRANSNYASNEYFLPVMGLVFLRHAYSRYLAVKDAIVAALPDSADHPQELRGVGDMGAAFRTTGGVRWRGRWTGVIASGIFSARACSERNPSGSLSHCRRR